ncbi:hypothetical protein [Roseateles sp. BYS87W]|uniref:Uncharacterized protein n=1 Tax=Pelomonas baiyunensis TaxID=3299026 RepID=A0ABW7GVS7_9BURK
MRFIAYPVLTMRAAFGLLALVITLAIVLSLSKRQAASLRAPATAAPSASAAAPALPAPQAVGQQVQSALDAAAQRQMDAAASAVQ